MGSESDDPVSHPSHYTPDGAPEAIDVIEGYQLGFRLGNVVKYVLRAGLKGTPVTDLEKARWYLDREISARVNQFLAREKEEDEESAQPEQTSAPRKYKGYGPNWPQQRARAHARDGGICQNPEHRNPEPDDGSNVVHHIRPLAEFNGDTEAANQLDNLTTLCRVCHGIIHRRMRMAQGAVE